MDEFTDSTTERMRTETGHDCLGCSTRVRNLHATASNAARQMRATLETGQDAARASRKLAELERELERWTSITEGHFAAMNDWRRP